MEIRFDTVELPTGVALRCAEHGAPGGQPVVFLHGWPDSWFTFSSVLPRLPPRYRAIAMDQRGFGDSERPAEGYAIHDFAADIVALLDALAIGRATLVGHSFGSFVARAVAILAPARAARLVLIGSGLPAANAVTREVRSSLAALDDPVPVAFAREFQAGTAYRPLDAAFFEGIIAESLKLPASLWRTTFERLLEYDDAGDLGRIEAPTLLMWGDRDALFSRADQDRLLAAIPNARLVVYEETGHCPNWERAERVAADLVAFLSDS